MTGYDWYSDQVVEAAVDGIRDEARKWYQLSDRMAVVARLAADQKLELTAFAVTDVSGPVTAYDLKHAYDTMHSWLTTLFGQAVVEFDNFGDALLKCADWYETADRNSAKSFDEIAAS